MPHADFIHLRVHSAYSLSEGAIQINDLVGLCQNLEMPAVAVTDTNNLFGALEFSKIAAESGVQPIIGCQINVQPTSGSSLPGKQASIPLICGPMVFLAKNVTGYRNLLKMITYAYLKAEKSYSPYITLEVLETYSDGLIALTGGALGLLGMVLTNGQRPLAENLLDTLQNIFGNRLYMEIQRHGTSEEQTTEEAFIDLAYNRDIPLVATNEVYFAGRNMHEAHDALLCIADGTYVSQTERVHKTPEHYLKRVPLKCASYSLTYLRQ